MPTPEPLPCNTPPLHRCMGWSDREVERVRQSLGSACMDVSNSGMLSDDGGSEGEDEEDEDEDEAIDLDEEEGEEDLLEDEED